MSNRSQQKPAKASSWTPAKQSLREISKLLRARHGGPCDTDDAVVWLKAAIPFIAEITGGIDAPKFAGRLDGWCFEFLPKVRDAEIEDATEEARERAQQGRLFWSAGALGDLLRLTTTEREEYRFRMMRPGGMSDADFKAYQRLRKTEHKKAARLRDGMAPQEASLSRTKPWEAMGISRAQWYRLPPEQRETTLGPIDKKIRLAPKLSHASRADNSTPKRRRISLAQVRPANDNAPPSHRQPLQRFLIHSVEGEAQRLRHGVSTPSPDQGGTNPSLNPPGSLREVSG